MAEPNEHSELRGEADAWLEENRPPIDPGFLLPETFMEVGTDDQFHYLRDWQQRVYEAGYLGMAWPKEYGGGGQPQVCQDIVNAEMARLQVPFVPNTIGLNWAGPLILAIGSEEIVGVRTALHGSPPEAVLHLVVDLADPTAQAGAAETDGNLLQVRVSSTAISP